jgi:signal transduction histidine kinase
MMGLLRRLFANRSLQSKLLARLSAVCIAFCLLVGAVLFLVYRSANSDILFENLQENMKSLQHGLHHQADGSWHLDPDSIGSHITYVIRDTAGNILLQGGRDLDVVQLLPLANASPDSGISSFFIQRPLKNGKPLKRRLFTLVSSSTVENLSLVIQVSARPSSTKAGIDALTQEWLGEFLPFAVPMSLVLLLVLTLTLRGALAPLERLQRYAEAIGPTRTDLRLPTDGLPSELLRPVQTVNAALKRLDDGFRIQRDFLADAAHELRTPLAILAAHLDSLGGGINLAPLKADVDRMTRLVSQMTTVAQLEALTIQPDDSADLSAISLELAALLAPYAISHKRNIAVNGADLPIVVRGNPDAIYQALRNLVENALRYTAEGTEVELTLDVQGKVAVCDRGPGIPKADRQKLFNRFWRADRSSTGNSGLGLAIAQRIAALHHGSLEIDDNPGGGARFTLQIPLLARA